MVGRRLRWRGAAALHRANGLNQPLCWPQTGSAMYRRCKVVTRPWLFQSLFSRRPSEITGELHSESPQRHTNGRAAALSTQARHCSGG
jgi:hypothetical protein